MREPSGNRIQDNADEDLAGVTTSGTIVIEQLSYDSDVVDRQTVETSEQLCLGVSVGKKCHEAAGVSLSPGFYRIYPEGQPANGYPISVGDPQQQIQTITSDLEDRAGQLTQRGERIVELATQEKIVRKTTSTYSKNGTAGKFNLSVPKDVNTLQVQAYTPAAEDMNITDVENASFEDLQQIANLETYNESFYITPAPESVDVPANETSIRAVEVNSIPFQGIDKSLNKSEWLRNLLENETYADIASDYLEPPSEMNSTEIEDLHSELSDLADENENLRERLTDREDINVTLDPDQNTDKLKAEIEALRQEITQIEGGLNTGDPETDIGDGTVDATIPFDGDLAPDGASVVANNVQTGETTTVSEEYWSVNKRTGRSDQLVIEDFPIDADTAQIAFGITASSEDGQNIADTQVPITNPAFSGNALALQAIDVTTVMPGPSESVTVEPTVGSDSVGIESVNATVRGPDGERPTTNPAADEVRFETNGAGSYQIQLTITDANGQQWSETVSIQAIEETVSQDPSIRAIDGFTGPLALAGDGLEGGSVDTSGSELEVAAISPRDNIPSSLHVYAEGISNNHQDITVNLLKETGEGEPEQARRNAKVFVHVTELPKDTVAYREGNQPLGIGSDTAYGGAHPSDRGDAHVIKTHTSDDGSVTIEVHKDPGFFTSAFYDVQTTVPILLPRPSALSPLATVGSAVLPILEVAVDLVATLASLVAEPATTVTIDAPVDGLAAAHGGTISA
ncbi:hypothetical protein A6E15_19475 [Natrinema saccharevitans]|uniref:Uncharacterized protein n=1 Tax=Natrinema saccharevitans TaxID=301967 RepID=A0A1S8AQX0_9EURY|nr:hypothetical protein [Natrinema saccharevitans]OLZ39060.1 hypothetical protein A6E15_19030 [Natrinema saccharevitans]OLZ39146.1 hypothetical protein A6E15_19475 [Natrinema saccharevitans]